MSDSIPIKVAHWVIFLGSAFWVLLQHSTARVHPFILELSNTVVTSLHVLSGVTDLSLPETHRKMFFCFTTVSSLWVKDAVEDWESFWKNCSPLYIFIRIYLGDTPIFCLQYNLFLFIFQIVYLSACLSFQTFVTVWGMYLAFFSFSSLCHRLPGVAVVTERYIITDAS